MHAYSFLAFTIEGYQIYLLEKMYVLDQLDSKRDLVHAKIDLVHGKRDLVHSKRDLVHRKCMC